MHPDRVTFPDGSNGLEAGVMDMLQRLQSGRLAGVQRRAGLVRGIPALSPQIRADRTLSATTCSAATRYALMGLRHARTYQ